MRLLSGLTGQRLEKGLFLLLSLLLSACSSTPVSVETAGHANQADERPGSVSETVAPPARGLPQISKPSEQRETLSVSAQVYSGALQQLEQGRWHEAVETAERGLRIDRHNAQLYWVLSHCYAELGDPARSRGFAQQGLSYLGESDRALEGKLRVLASE